MKILHIVNSDDRYGSAQSFLELLKQEICTPDIKPYVVTPKNNRIISYCKKNKIPCKYIAYWPFQIPHSSHIWHEVLKYMYYVFRHACYNSQAKKKLLALIKQEKPNVIHTNSCIINIGAELSRISHIPHVWHLREFGKEDYNFYALKKDHISYMNQYTTRFIAISQAVKKVWVQKGLDETKIEVICHGVDSKKFSLVQMSRNIFAPIRIVMCGSFLPAKGQLRVLYALDKLSNYEKQQISIDFYGSTVGNYYKQFERLVYKLGLDNVVHIKGYASNLPDILHQYDVGLMYSRAEAMGRVTIEYMLAGLCPIAPRCGANAEIIEDNQCGLLFDYNNEQTLTKVLQQIIANPSILQCYTKKSYQISREKYDSNHNIPYIIDLFRQVAYKMEV